MAKFTSQVNATTDTSTLALLNDMKKKFEILMEEVQGNFEHQSPLKQDNSVHEFLISKIS
jgi:hypothetical protein